MGLISGDGSGQIINIFLSECSSRAPRMIPAGGQGALAFLKSPIMPLGIHKGQKIDQDRYASFSRPGSGSTLNVRSVYTSDLF